MKKITLILALLFSAISFAQISVGPVPVPISQNQSFGSVSSSIFTPIPQQFSGGEIFRFRPGLVTQLDKGNAFDFNNSRWFSIGKLKTGTQTVFGLRFQLPNTAITMGYQDIADLNPRIQWVGSGTDLEFRAANSFTSTNSKLVATMTNDGRTYFGDPLAAFDTKVSIDYTEVSGASSRVGLTLESDASQNGVFTTAIRSVNNAGGFIKTGLDIESTTGSSFENTGINIRLNGGTQNTGVRAFVTDNGSDGPTYGVFGSIASTADVAVPAFGAAIYGTSSTDPNRFAGYFNGNVFVTGTFTVSDKKLKDNIKNEENVLDKLAQLDAVTYTFKPNDQLNLPSELQHGFLAQNLEEVFPELVTTINKPILDKENKQTGIYEYKAVNYTGLISVLTSSLQELNEKATASIDELNEKVASLESQLEELRGEAGSSKENKLDNAGEVGFSMEQNRPNPFTDQTVVNYTLPSNTKATIAVVDLSGKFIKEYNLSNQKGQLTINSSDIGKGIFIYTLISDNEVMISKKMIVR
ncbi:tail fiber domain-containing protein [Kordia sp. YSTF-M3]|uniref:Tail fiber domain-containing protein n=1 Tax=Kordia aestuariivivens TaxID=2759037 RepID=A0ABR7Q3S1_9FLAO|nr:tail fiber domain-containing protein [Kordia aestuariivivens]MBC8753206.1 tail fiber domain-containing protein [Kordia aestuariivivens]